MQERGNVVVKIRKVFLVLSIMLLMGLYSGVLYANDSSEGYNIETTTVVNNDLEVEILQSQDNGYLQITQIGQNSQNVKITTSTFDEKILVSGKVAKGTSITFKVYQNKKCLSTYSSLVGATGIFSQTLDLKEGDNEVYLYYTNSQDDKDNYVMITIRKESAESMETLKTWINVPSL